MCCPSNLRGPTGRTITVKVVVDTGFTNALALPSTDIEQLELPWVGDSDAQLADGTVTSVAVFSGEVMWDGVSRQVSIVSIEGEPLVGMNLMKGYRLTVDVVDGGLVRLENMP